MGDLLDEATRAEHDGEGEDNEDISDDDASDEDASDPKPKPPPIDISATQFSPGRLVAGTHHACHMPFIAAILAVVAV